MAVLDNGMTGATLSVTQTIALWTVVMPPVREVRRHNPGDSPAFAADVRNAEMVVVGTSLVVALLMSRMERSYAPMVVTVVLLATLLGAYEYTLRKPGYSGNPTS